MALPNTYYRLDYIQSSGSQYINTGFTPSGTTRFDVGFNTSSLIGTTGFGTIFGSRQNHYTRGYQLTTYSDDTTTLKGHFLYGTSANSSQGLATIRHNADIVVGSDMHIVYAENTLTSNDVVVDTISAQSFTAPSPIYIFALNGNGSATEFSNTKLQFLLIYDNNVLVRNFIPAMRKSDSVVGLYDDVNDVFYTNAGSGSFTYGSIVYEVNATENPTDSGIITGTGTYPSGSNMSLLATANSGYLFDYWELQDYTRLEYIETDGNSVINTLWKPTSDYAHIKTRMYLTSSSSQIIMGINKSGGGGYCLAHYPNASNLLIYNGTNTYTKSFSYIRSDWNDIEYISNNGSLVGIINSNTRTYAYGGSIVNSGYNGYFAVLGRRDGSSYVYAPSGTRLEYFQILDSSDNLIRNYIPVKRNSDNEIGLLDLVEMKFYGNDGTGAFTGGNELGKLTYTNNPLSLVVNSDLNLIANFKINYQITLTYDSTLGSASYSWVSGTQIELVATPNSNAQFKGWYINSIPISTNAIYTYTVLSDVTIEARFERVWDITTNVSGNGSIQFTRGTDRNDVVFSVIADTNNHFVKYVVDGVEYTTTPLTLYLTQDTTITAYFEENERYHITVNSNFPYGSFYISDNDVFAGTIVTIWARPFPDYNFVKWQDGTLENPRQIEVNSDITLVAEYQRSFETNGIYQYRCYVKDQLDLEAPPKAFMRVDNFDIKRDTMTKSNSTIYVMDTATNVNNGDVLVVYDPMGTNLYEGVVKSMEGNKIICSQMPSFYKGLWIYNVSPQDYLEHEIAVLLQAYADGQIYRSSYTDTMVAQRLGGITINYVGSTAVNLPTDLDDNGNEKLTQKDMEQWIYELYENYGIIFDFQINMAGANYVTIKTPSYETIKVGNNMYAIQDMSPITEIEETNRLIIFSSKKVYRTTYVATKNGVVEQPTSTNNRFDITNTKVVFSDDDVDTLIANNLPEQMYNHKLTFTLIIKNFLYEFGDFNLGGELDVWVNDDYYNTVLTGYQIKKASNQNITEVGFTCGKVRVALTKKLTMGVVL